MHSNLEGMGSLSQKIGTSEEANWHVVLLEECLPFVSLPLLFLQYLVLSVEVPTLSFLNPQQT
jgi:hypothetical protein